MKKLDKKSIMSEIFNMLHEEAENNGSVQELTCKEALGREGSRKYFEKEELVTFLKSLREPELQYMEAAITSMKNRVRMNDPVAVRRDKVNRRYKFYGQNRSNGNKGFKIILEAGMDKFFEDYIEGRFVPDFTLKELYLEAIK